jgi:putative transposase
VPCGWRVGSRFATAGLALALFFLLPLVVAPFAREPDVVAELRPGTSDSQATAFVQNVGLGIHVRVAELGNQQYARTMGRSTEGRTRLSERREYRSWTAKQKMEIVLRRPLERRKRPGLFRVERPRRLWQLDLTSVWVAERGWCYLMAAIDCCTREIVAWHLELRCRAEEAIALVERAAARYAIEEGELTLGSDNGSAFTARRFRARLAELGIRQRRGGYRDPESQAFIESWFGKLKEREVWLNEYETLDDARRGIGGYVDRYHHRPHSGLDYKTPLEVRQTWEDLQKTAA